MLASTRLQLALVGLSAFALLSACGDDDTKRSAADSGNDAALVWMPDASPERDAAPEAGVRACEQARESLPPQSLPRCSAATRDCVVACAGASDVTMCRSACLEGDKTPASSGGITCAACVYLQLLACADRNGCHAETAETFCCLEDECGQGSAPGCGDAVCGTKTTAAITCAFTNAPACLEFTAGLPGECFATADDAGVEDGGS